MTKHNLLRLDPGAREESYVQMVCPLHNPTPQMQKQPTGSRVEQKAKHCFSFTSVQLRFAVIAVLVVVMTGLVGNCPDSTLLTEAMQPQPRLELSLVQRQPRNFEVNTSIERSMAS
ncbi:hypothetical protein L207DRAFT_304397 [Hyaloscypha variabilis F]|uniref:Uncharacterized protein n=1 Tax=Hyaloscypha variabilis (strain UAMH 11265 / GT02V1 / F) TaxID=1149755 RepID=A0A2J6QR68_HYAVF|nr:hypothetical protein L207DRAFT_304397 [Hyaloscypha variabilis F]